MNLITELGVPLIGSIITGIIGVIKSFKFIHEGERGVRLRFGKAVRDKSNKPIIIEPGFVLLIPFVDTLLRHHVRQQSYRFETQQIVLKDGLIYKIGGMVVFKVNDIYKALFEINDLDSSIDDIGMAAIRDELQHHKHEELQDLDKISEKLLERVKVRAAEWGVEIIQFSLPVCAPTPETAHLINASLSVNLRLKALSEGVGKHNMKLSEMSPNLAAVLVGIPVAVNLNNEYFQPSRNGKVGISTEEEESADDEG